MIIVFSEFGGEDLLGKARELADSVGDRVLALVSAEKDPQRLVYLGADEVIRGSVKEPGEWVSIISDLLRTENRVRTLLFPFNIISSVIAGAVYSIERDSIGGFMDGVDYIDGSTMARALDSTNFALERSSSKEKVNLITINLTSVTPSFEDSSRNGRTREGQLTAKDTISFPLKGVPEETVNSQSDLTVIAGDEKSVEFAKKLSKRYHAKFVKYSGAIEIVYGPCVAIEVSEKLRYLPEFKGDLITLNTTQSPINAISDISVVSPEIGKIIESLIR